MDNTTPFFSIIVPTYNHAHFIKRCLDSLVNQTYENWEAIVVNNFSDDNTIEIVKEYTDPRIRLINNANGGVIAVSRNKGISEANGDWICFLDSDDWWYTNKLEVSLKFLKNFDLVYHNLDKYYSLDMSKGKVHGRALYGDITKDLLVNSNGIPNSSAMIRKAVVDDIGFISEDKGLIAVEDSDYWLRASFVTNKFKFIDQSLGAYWIGGNISVSEKQIIRENNLFAKYKHLLNDDETKLANCIRSLSRARILHKLGKFNEAKKEYQISFGHNKFSNKFKSIIGIITCSLRIQM